MRAPGARAGRSHAGAAEHDLKGLRDELEVHPDRPVVDVVEVHLDPALERHGVAAVDLPDAGEPGLDRDAAALPPRVLLDLARDRRPRADEAQLGEEKEDNG